ncbi:MAG: chorismate synthase [Elusimicrobiales bacterium]|nr:chorismate synthase [Elusimicrobiales bacterium]
MNYLTAGDSHGKYICGIISGIPSGIKIKNEYIKKALEKRRALPGRSLRQKIENDEFEIISGIYNNKTTGMPIGIILKNKSNKRYPNKFIPLHGEYFGALKYQHKDYSIARERLSQRETAMRVALFCFTKKMIEDLEIKIESQVISCYGNRDKTKFKELIEKFYKDGNSFGGIFQIKIKNIIAGLGGFSQGFERLQSRISSILFTLGSIKGIEFGAGFSSEIFTSKDFIKNPQLLGGIEGGISRGDEIIIRCVTRPLSAVKAIDKESISDITSVFTAAYISEFLISYILADEIMKKFGSDVFDDIKDAYIKWKKNL